MNGRGTPNNPLPGYSQARHRRAISPPKSHFCKPREAEGHNGRDQAGIWFICGSYWKSWFKLGNRNIKSREKMSDSQKQNGGNRLLLTLSREGLGAMSHR